MNESLKRHVAAVRSSMASLREEMKRGQALISEARSEIAGGAGFHLRVQGFAEQVRALSLRVITESDALWQTANEILRAHVQGITSGVERSLAGVEVPVGTSAHLNETGAQAMAAMDRLREEATASAIDAITKSGLLTPAQLIEAGRLIKALATDNLPGYGVFEWVARNLAGFDIDEQVWDKLAAPAKQELCVGLFQRASVNTTIATHNANQALEAVRLLGEMAKLSKKP